LDIINSLNFNNFNEYDNNIFKKNVYPEIDNIIDELNISTNFINLLTDTLAKYVDDKKIFNKKSNENITIKYNDRDGYHLLITNRRCVILQKNLEVVKELSIGKYKLNISDLEFIPMPKSSYTKINCNKIKQMSNEIIVIKNILAKIIKEKFKEQLNFISTNYKNIFNYWINNISFIDFINSGAITAIKNHYCKPVIEYNEVSYFNANGIRHPIVEYILDDYEYKPQNLSLSGNNQHVGILLYGINSSGKSTLMKSIGLNIILAQIGYYVAAESFIYSPYHLLCTRINGNDNLYKGLSSFMVEMIEVTSILKRNNKNTIVLADEICRGTENKSANIIVAYMLKAFSEVKTTFITATHLHELPKLSIIQDLKNVTIKHLQIINDNDKLIFNRQLMDGQGESFYGLMVAKHLMKDNHFNNLTEDILKDYDGYNIKKSNYNSNNYLIECYICKNKKNLESHHIQFQKKFNDQSIDDTNIHYKKDSNYNLATLCSQCHDKVDSNNIIINGWIETSNGKELDYYLNDNPEKNKKYSNELIKFIKSLKYLNDPKLVRIKIKETYNKKVSTKSIIQLWE